MDRGRIDKLEFKIVGRCVEVWLTPMDHPEGKYLFTIDRSLIKNLIAVLTRARTYLY